MLGSCVLCLGLSNATLAIDNLTEELEELEKIEAEQHADNKGGLPGLKNGAHMIKGEVLRIERENYLVKQIDGKQVRLQIDESTQMTGNIGQGEHIEAKVYDEHHVFSIRQAE
jgi:gamma-glutamylcyclotransferase (GGCT)/AIG2-like uncharacterized protein YtfP